MSNSQQSWCGKRLEGIVLVLLRSIGFKLIVSMIAFSTICIGVFVYSLDIELRAQFEKDIILQARETEERISRDISDGMLMHGNKDIYKFLKNTGYRATVRILRTTGEIVASTNSDEEWTFITNKDRFCGKCHDSKTDWKLDVKERYEYVVRGDGGDRRVNITTSIANKKSCTTSQCHTNSRNQEKLGLIDVEVSLVGIDERLAMRHSNIISFSIILLSGLLLGGSLIVYRIVYQPLYKIIRGIKEVSSGNMDKPIVLGHLNNEIGYLADSFNEMTVRIKEMAAEMGNLNIELEDKLEKQGQELKKSQDSIIQSEKLASMGLMTAAIAHEINNPLTSVLTYSSLLKKAAEEGSELHEDLQVIVSETLRCRDIVRGLLDFARETDFSQEAVNINDIIEEVIALLSGQVVFQDIAFVKTFSSSVPKMTMDAGQIKQVFLNIMLNSADAMPHGGTLSISTSFDYERNDVTIRVKDTGIGISESDLQKIFDPFFTTKEKDKGTGLGLSVAYGIIQRHNGAVTVSSALGKGTTFVITFHV